MSFVCPSYMFGYTCEVCFPIVPRYWGLLTHGAIICPMKDGCILRSGTIDPQSCILRKGQTTSTQKTGSPLSGIASQLQSDKVRSPFEVRARLGHNQNETPVSGSQRDANLEMFQCLHGVGVESINGESYLGVGRSKVQSPEEVRAKRV
jgi:hypothetical protein